MTTISRLMQLTGGILRGVDLASNTLAVNILQVGGISGTTLSKTQLDALLAISSNLASTATGMGASLIGIEDFATIFAATTVEGALAEVKGEADGAVSVNTTQTTNIGNLVTLSGVAANSTALGAFTGTVGTGIGSSATIKQAIQSVSSAVDATNSVVQKFTWLPAVLAWQIAPPGSPTTGMRYLVKATATGDWAGQEDKIAEYGASSWSFTAPALGEAVLVDSMPTAMFIYGGAAWAVQYFESTTASTGLTKSTFDIQLADVNTGGLSVSSGAFSVNVDNSSIEKGAGAGNPLQVKAAGIVTAMLAANAVGAAKLRLENATYLRARNAADSADISIVEVDASNNIMFAAIPYGPSSAPSANYQFANKKYVDDSVAGGSSLTLRAVVVGESMAANTSFMVRWAVSGETAGRVYKADKDASTADKFHVIGMVQTTASLSAGDAATLVMLGSKALASSDSSFSSGDVGKPVYLGAAGAFSTTASSTVGDADVIVAYVENTGIIDVKPAAVMGVV